MKGFYERVALQGVWGFRKCTSRRWVREQREFPGLLRWLCKQLGVRWFGFSILNATELNLLISREAESI